MKKAVWRMGLALFLGLACAASAAAAPVGTVTGLPLPRYASLKTDRVNLREGPSKDHATKWVFQRAGLPVEITAEFATWRKVRDSEGAEGWVLHTLLSGRRTGLVGPGKKDIDYNVTSNSSASSAVVAQVAGRRDRQYPPLRRDMVSGLWPRLQGLYVADRPLGGLSRRKGELSDRLSAFGRPAIFRKVQPMFVEFRLSVAPVRDDHSQLSSFPIALRNRARSRSPTPLRPTAAETASTARIAASGASSRPRGVAVVEPARQAAGKGEHGDGKHGVDGEEAAAERAHGVLELEIDERRRGRRRHHDDQIHRRRAEADLRRQAPRVEPFAEAEARVRRDELGKRAAGEQRPDDGRHRRGRAIVGPDARRDIASPRPATGRGRTASRSRRSAASPPSRARPPAGLRPKRAKTALRR